MKSRLQGNSDEIESKWVYSIVTLRIYNFTCFESEEPNPLLKAPALISLPVEPHKSNKPPRSYIMLYGGCLNIARKNSLSQMKKL